MSCFFPWCNKREERKIRKMKLELEVKELRRQKYLRSSSSKLHVQACVHTPPPPVHVHTPPPCVHVHTPAEQASAPVVLMAIPADAQFSAHSETKQNRRRGKGKSIEVYLTVQVDHNVDETSEIMMRHNIIRVRKGEDVKLLRGTLEHGLGGSYADYIEIERFDGRIGKISRKIVTIA